MSVNHVRRWDSEDVLCSYFCFIASSLSVWRQMVQAMEAPIFTTLAYVTKSV